MRSRLSEELFELESTYRERMSEKPHLPEPVGKNPKYWLVSMGKRYLFKLATFKEQNGEPVYNDVSECIASDIGELIGLPMAEYYLCTNNGVPGVITLDFLDNELEGPKKEEFVDGVYLISLIDEGFKNGSLLNPQTKQYYTVDLVLRSVEKYGLIQDAINMMVYDALIGNRDRNPSNYGIIYNHETKKYRFAPLYDNGTSLALSMPQKRLSKCVDEFGNIVDEEHMEEVIQKQFLGKITLERFFQYKEKLEWDKKQIEKAHINVELKKRELQPVLESRRMKPDVYHEILRKIANERIGYDISTLEYQSMIEYFTNHYPNEIEGIMHAISNAINEHNIDKLFDVYQSEIPRDRLIMSKQLVLRRAKWMVDYYYTNRVEVGGKTL